MSNSAQDYRDNRASLPIPLQDIDMGFERSVGSEAPLRGGGSKTARSAARDQSISRRMRQRLTEQRPEKGAMSPRAGQ
ncbi:hypothetical protein NPX13_g7205 [Xylaria arbuscula]|uniref:Uncharacterized protein n=1 Tax=Xylaria arbuscula TaxID=114810 RepID=A0A9W8TJF1_9PEZI|nr:hypothetical protein NPX13_g7205 [Xylaria arbuscula]